jgi:prophage regulatory protein
MAKIIRFKQLKTIVPLSRSSIWRRIQNGSFPNPISLGGKAVGWLESDILSWIEQQQKTSSQSNNQVN